MEYTPYEKLRNRILLLIIMIPIATRFDLQKSIELLRSNFIWPLIIILILWSIRNYKIYIGSDIMQFHRVFGELIEVNGNLISKIEIESNRSGKWNWEMIYIHTNEKIYEYSITNYNQNELLKRLISFCATNSIVLDTSLYKKKRFDII